ncbi:MAG TPA: isoprenylcysteine carboxylmethyltransferase family protein [Terriglobales bacterium]|jgi:protein-S-isoprenylcysteine O-methyltransferase Ste14
MWKYFSLEMIIRYLAVLFSYVWGGIEVFQHVRRRQQNRGRGRTDHDKGTLMLLYGAIGVGYGIGIPFAFSPYGRIAWGKPYLAIFGLLVIVAGICIRFIAMQTLGKHFSYTVNILVQHELIEQGLYRYIRHPAYLGELLIFVGIGLSFANWISLVSLFVFPFIALSVRMNVEEKALLGHFAARYVEYRKRTWRLIPWSY